MLRSNLLYFIALIFLTIWAVGFLVFNTGDVIHILLVIAIVAFILRLLKWQRSVRARRHRDTHPSVPKLEFIGTPA
ncbi:MAG: lmo0937 family membrane protein [Bacteroidota bacterium]